MLEGMSGEKISLSIEENGHLLCLGKSGSGKSFYIYRRLEELWKTGTGSRRYAVLDYSNSFTKEEMKKAGFGIDGKIFYLNLEKDPYFVSIGETDDQSAGNMIRDILSDVFKIKSYMCKSLLADYCIKFVKSEQKDKPLSEIFLAIAKDLNASAIANRDKRASASKLVEQMYALEQCKIGISRDICSWKEGIHIVQLSDLCQSERKLYVNLLLRLYWHQVQNLKAGFFSTYVVDEFQHLDLSVALEEFLREGRKFGVSVIFSSQYIGEGQKKYISAIKQAANQMFFRPVDSDIRALAEMLDEENTLEWKKILSRLQTGQAVLSGSYRVNENKKVLYKPVVVNVKM